MAWAQNTNKVPKRIAFIPDLVPATLEIWRAEMRILGWTEGQDFIVMQSGIEAGSRNRQNSHQYRVAH